MINSKKLFFAQNLSRINSVHLTKIEPLGISGFCGTRVMGDLSSYVLSRGYVIEFSPTDSSILTADFFISF